MAGLERNIDGGGPLQGVLGKIHEALRGAMSGSAGRATAEVEVTVRVDTDTAEREFDAAMRRIREAEGRGGAVAPSPAYPRSDVPGLMVPRPGPGTAATILEEVYGPSAPDRRFSGTDPGAYRRPQDFGDPAGHLDPSARAEQLWGTLKGGSAFSTMRNAAGFKAQWGEHLGEGSKKDLDSWLVAAGRQEGYAASGAYEGIEKAGAKIARLMKQMEEAAEGTPERVKAAEEIIALKRAVEELALAGVKAADAIGGENGLSLRKELERTKEAANQGQVLPEASEGGAPGFRNLGIRDLQYMARNPLGAAKSLATEGILRKLKESGLAQAIQAGSLTGEGGAIASLGGGAGGAMAVGGLGVGALLAGLAGGWALNSRAADAGVADADGKIADMRMSRGLGRGFDFRGLTWNDDRTHAKSQDELFGMGIANPRLAFQTLAQMGVGMDTFEGGGVAALRMGGRVQRTALDMGVEGGALAQFLGTAMRSGEVGRSEKDATAYLARIAGLVAEGNKIGIGTGEKLGVLASLRQMEQAQTGYISPESARLTENFSRILDATGNPALRGQAGLGPIQALANNQNPELQAMAIRSFLGGDGRMSRDGAAAARGALGGKVYDDMRRGGADDIAVAQAALENPGTKLAFIQNFLKGAGKDLSGFQLESLMGASGMSKAQFYSVVGAVRDGKDITTMPEFAGPGAKKLGGRAGAVTDAMAKEGFDAMTVQGAAAIQAEMLRTTQSMEKLLQVIALNTAKNQMIQDAKKGVTDTADELAAWAVDTDGNGRWSSWKSGAGVLIDMYLESQMMKRPAGMAQAHR